MIHTNGPILRNVRGLVGSLLIAGLIICSSTRLRATARLMPTATIPRITSNAPQPDEDPESHLFNFSLGGIPMRFEINGEEVHRLEIVKSRGAAGGRVGFRDHVLPLSDR